MKPLPSRLDKTTCPCGSGEDYTACCEPLHLKKAKAKTAEQLMRSRYSAYVKLRADYLYNTTHPDSRTHATQPGIVDTMHRIRWTQLELLKTSQGSESDKVGKVEFKAHLIEKNSKGIHHEISRFKRFKGDWHYFDGEDL